MWLVFLLLAALGIAVLGSLIGLAFLAIPIAIVLALGAFWIVSRSAAEVSAGDPAKTGTAPSESDGRPQDIEKAGRAKHVETGYAHTGQEHMTPDQS